jgi:ribonuclease BN (tRNA processing enzyme)
VEVGDKVIAYTGDGEWTDEMAQMGQGTDLVIAECYYYAKPINPSLSHMSSEMLSHIDTVPEECAHDGMVVEI